MATEINGNANSKNERNMYVLTTENLFFRQEDWPQ